MRYYSFNQYLQERYGTRVHRLSLDAGFTCPNRDGSAGTGGCVFCSEKGFSRFAGARKTLKEQMTESAKFAKERYKAGKFLAYFQNATNTYAPVSELKKIYDVVRDFPEIVGLFISTRPDCVDEEKLDLIKSYSDRYEVWVEYGFQTSSDKTLEMVNRGHTVARSVKAIEMTASKGIKVGVHVILGLPGESTEEMAETAKLISSLPVSGVKFHALHVLKGTELEKWLDQGRIKLLSRTEYVNAVCDFLENLRPDCVVLRLVSDARKDVLVAPEWMRDKSSVIRDIERELEARSTCQGIKVPGDQGIRRGPIV
ncbi:MAG: TIGR01212 family radical SAM protein [Candidatus Omnitrophota bacterium]